ncbi:MAG: DUF86 domain-containing protein [Ottowia sp.]|uniref:HepT-like ribonuclease domain-containing protein n=1 Tax=Ottowia sp. TaxID=1898956 RepID=UPI0039E5B16C
MTKDKGAYLAAIHECIRRIRRYTQGGKTAYLADTLVQDAVMRNIEIIGQAVKDFGVEELASRDSTVPWKQIAGMRDLLAHQYLGVDMDITWAVVERHLAPLNAAVEHVAVTLGVHLPAFDA